MGRAGVEAEYEMSDGAGENASLGWIEGEWMVGSGVSMEANGAAKRDGSEKSPSGKMS